MKKIIVIFLALFSIYFILPVEQLSAAELNSVEPFKQMAPRFIEEYGSKVLDNGDAYYFSTVSLTNGKLISISYNLNKSGTIEIYFHNMTTGKSTYIKTIYGSSGTASYTANSRCSGYLYLRNVSGKTLTVNSGILYN